MPNLSYFEVLVIIILFGGFGGLASSIFDNFDDQSGQKSKEHDCKKCNNSYFFRRFIIGSAGAFCLAFIGFCLNQIEIISSTKNLLFLSCFSVASGVVSFTILPQLRRKLGEKLLNEKMDQINAKAENAVSTSAENMEYTKIMFEAQAAIQTKIKIDMDTAIDNLKKIRDKFKRDRVLNIYLGRLFRFNGNLNDAIMTLRNFIEEIDKNPSQFSKAHDSIDKGDAYYNIACYHALKAEPLDKSPERDRLINEAYEAFKYSIDLSKSNLEYAKTDKDLMWLFEKEEKFQEFKG